MKTYTGLSAALAGLLMVSGVACDDDDDLPKVDAGSSDSARGGAGGASGAGGGGAGGGGAGGAAADAPVEAGDGAAANLFQRLGGEAGIKTVITDFVVNRVLKDPKINGYFLNSTVDGGTLINCLVLQVGTLTGGPAGLSLRRLPRHEDVPRGDEDLDAGLQRSGRPPGGRADRGGRSHGRHQHHRGRRLPDGQRHRRGQDQQRAPSTSGWAASRPSTPSSTCSSAKVVADARINGFFGTANAARLKTCLVRQVCSIDGPCKYGKEVATASEPGWVAGQCLQGHEDQPHSA